jgi:hypothetical protein
MTLTDILLNDLRPTIGYFTLIGIAWSGLIARRRLLYERDVLERSSRDPTRTGHGKPTGHPPGR